MQPWMIWFDLGAADNTTDPILAYRCPESMPSRMTRADTIPLPFHDFHFTLACSTYPFFETESVDTIFAQLKELLRVAKEVRLAPYILQHEQVLKKVGPLMLALQQENVGVEMKSITQEPGHPPAVMLRFWAQQCQIR